MNETPHQTISLIDSLLEPWFKLPLEIVRDVGPAAQTFAGLLSTTNDKTFVAAEKIASSARLPLATARKHLVALQNRGWIANRGRERTRHGRPRRTATLAITQYARKHLEPWAFLPWWACCRPRNGKRLGWSDRLLLAIVMKRLCSLAGAIEQQDGHGADPEDLEGTITNWGDENRFRFSLSRLERDTGMTRETIVHAKRGLHRRKIIRWSKNDDGANADILAPNPEFVVAVFDVPNRPGFIFVDFTVNAG